MDNVEIDDQEGQPSVIKITGESLRSLNARRQTIDPTTGQPISEMAIPDEVPTPDRIAKSKTLEIGNLIRNKINDLPDQKRVQAFTQLGGTLGIGADNVNDLADRINHQLDTRPVSDLRTLAKSLDVNVDKFKDKKTEMLDSQGNVMGYRQGMASAKDMQGPRTVLDQQQELRDKVIKERRVAQLKTEINQDLDLEEINRLKAQNPDSGIMSFFKNMFQPKQNVGAGVGFMKALMATDPVANAQEVNKVDVPETGDTVSFPKQVGKYTVRFK
jgi:hypothetical protein